MAPGNTLHRPHPVTDWLNTTHLGDCRALMRQMIGDGVRVQCVVTSPPYWGLRDYGVAGALGLERSWQRHVAAMRGVFRLVHTLLTKDGVLWLNYGDSYYSPRIGGAVGANSTINGQGSQEAFRDAQRARRSKVQQSNLAGAITRGAANRRGGQTGIKPKDLVGMPWRIAFALQGDGWFLRSDVIWHKPNPMPESIRDRPTKAHEYVFLFSRSEQYHYDASAIAEPVTGNAHARGDGVNPKARNPPVGVAPGQPRSRPQGPRPAGWAEGDGSHSAKDHARAKADLKDSTKFGRGAGWRQRNQGQRSDGEFSQLGGRGFRQKQNESFSAAVSGLVETRNVRTVWTMPTQPFSGAHFATFPEELVQRCVLAGSRPGDIVFDPFMGSGTVAKVATDLGRQFIGCELSAEYLKLHELRRTTIGMPL